mmetsp:Transcript_140445/g.350122  ORF Transcript_140445/g.350122 Transcript_140445/m.350122 type:complete len:283 (-) Transcript_140445:308-1156(-)
MQEVVVEETVDRSSHEVLCFFRRGEPEPFVKSLAHHQQHHLIYQTRPALIQGLIRCTSSREPAREARLETTRSLMEFRPLRHLVIKSAAVRAEQEAVTDGEGPTALSPEQVHESGDGARVHSARHGMPCGALQPRLDRAQVVGSATDVEEVQVAIVSDENLYVAPSRLFEASLIEACVHVQRLGRRPLMRMSALEARLRGRREARVSAVHADAFLQATLHVGPPFHRLDLLPHQLGEVRAFAVDHPPSDAPQVFGITFASLHVSDHASALRPSHHGDLHHFL